MRDASVGTLVRSQVQNLATKLLARNLAVLATPRVLTLPLSREKDPPPTPLCLLKSEVGPGVVRLCEVHTCPTTYLCVDNNIP